MDIKCIARKSEPHTYPWLASLLRVAHQSGLGRTRNVGASAALPAGPQGIAFTTLWRETRETCSAWDVNGARGTHASIASRPSASRRNANAFCEKPREPEPAISAISASFGWLHCSMWALTSLERGRALGANAPSLQGQNDCRKDSIQAARGGMLGCGMFGDVHGAQATHVSMTEGHLRFDRRQMQGFERGGS